MNSQNPQVIDLYRSDAFVRIPPSPPLQFRKDRSVSCSLGACAPLANRVPNSVTRSATNSLLDVRSTGALSVSIPASMSSISD